MSERVYWLDQPKNIRLILRILYFICALLLAVDLLYHRHAIHIWEDVFGFYAIYGFVGCVVLVLIAKEMRKLLMRDESYYEKHDHKGDPHS